VTAISGGGKPLILHLSHTAEPGGAELALVRTLRVAGWDWRLQLPRSLRGGDDLYRPLIASHPSRFVWTGPTHSAGASSSPLRALALAGRVVATAVGLALNPAARRASLVVANSARNALYGYLACVLLRRRGFVVHLRDRIDKEFLGSAGAFAMKKLVLPRADGVVANSAATLATAAPYISRGCEAAVVASPIGISAEGRMSSIGRADPVVRTIGMVARLAPWKGQEMLLRAFAEAFPVGEVQLRFIGGTSFGSEAFERELVQLAADLGISSRVQFYGHVEDPEGALADVDICVQCSLRPEPLGQNVLQYLALGKVTVVADEGGPSEWVQNGVNGVRVAPRDTGALAVALRDLADDAPTRDRLESGARSTEIASDEDVTAQLGLFYRKVASRAQ
jgi:glycosyltransferase involved in cell wall biosynthesis